MICGSSLFEVGSNKQSVVKESISPNFKKSIPLKILILVGILVLILIIFGTAYSQGYLDNSLDMATAFDSEKASSE